MLPRVRPVRGLGSQGCHRFRGGSAASLDVELITVRVGHHDPATRRGMTAVIDDSRAEGHKPFDFLILRHAVGNKVKMNSVLDGLLFRYLDKHKPHDTLRGRANYPVGVTGHVHLGARPRCHLAPETCRRGTIRAVERHIQNRSAHGASLLPSDVTYSRRPRRRRNTRAFSLVALGDVPLWREMPAVCRSRTADVALAVAAEPQQVAAGVPGCGSLPAPPNRRRSTCTPTRTWSSRPAAAQGPRLRQGNLHSYQLPVHCTDHQHSLKPPGSLHPCRSEAGVPAVRTGRRAAGVLSER
jgi:hypothetical protein